MSDPWITPELIAFRKAAAHATWLESHTAEGHPGD